MRSGLALLGTVLTYTAVALSIIVAVTSPPPDTTLSFAIQSAGLFYRGAVGTLEEFAVSTTVPPLLFEVAYVFVGGVMVTLAGALVAIQVDLLFGDENDDEMGDGAFSVLSLFFGSACIIGLIAMVFSAGAQFLVLGIILFVTEIGTMLLVAF